MKPFRARIQAWHYGKLIVLGIWAALVEALILFFVLELSEDAGLVLLALGLAGIALLVVVPAAMSIVVWIWLSGKEVVPGGKRG